MNVLYVPGNPQDFPFEEIAASCRLHIGLRRDIYQRFSCASCGQRLTVEEPNTLFTHGTCDKCGTVTDIKAQGCNFRLVIPPPNSLAPQRSLIVKVTDPAHMHPTGGSA